MKLREVPLICRRDVIRSSDERARDNASTLQLEEITIDGIIPPDTDNFLIALTAASHPICENPTRSIDGIVRASGTCKMPRIRTNIAVVGRVRRYYLIGAKAECRPRRECATLQMLQSQMLSL